MRTIIFGDGPMGRAIHDELAAAGHAVRLLGRPLRSGHDPTELRDAEVALDFSIGAAVADNVDAALAGGLRRFVIGTTGWGEDRGRVETAILRAGAAAVVAPTFSPGASLLIGLVGRLASQLDRVGGYDPFVVEWHRVGKRDRPSGTALALAQQLAEATARQPELASLRAGSSPGMHVVGFDAVGETLELRLTARDRRCYAAGARLAADWLAAEERAPGFHPFASVTDALITERSPL